MAVSVKADTRKLVRKLRKLDAQATAGATVALREVMTRVMAEIIAKTPRDTNRLVRGYALAANGATLGPFQAPPLRESKRHGKAVEALERQLAFWQRIVERYEKQGRKDKWYNRAVRTRDRAAEQLRKLTKTSIVVGLFANPADAGRRLKTSVREKVYGGEGELKIVNGRPYVRIHNKEFHATFVERGQKDGPKGNRAVATALARARFIGIKRARRHFLRETAKGTGAAKRA